MPILWRYLLRSYLQVFLLCVTSFIAILLVTRFREIATFSSTGAPLPSIFLFALYQIPHILPIAIPISCLIAAILLFLRLSSTQELTAFRASGLGLWPITYPLIFAGAILSLLNFAVASELSPRCKFLSKELIYTIASVNPLSLFQKEAMIKMRDAHVDMKMLKTGKYAKDVVVVLKNLSNGRLGIMTAKELSLNGEQLNGKEVCLISCKEGKGSFDHLIIENQATMSTGASHFADFLRTANWQSHEEYLSLRMILAKRANDTNRKFWKIGSSELEVARRLSISLTPFTFTLLGTAFGMQIGRRRSKKGIAWAISLAAFAMISYMAAKSFRHHPPIAYFCYWVSHLVIIPISFITLKRVQKGVEA